MPIERGLKSLSQVVEYEHSKDDYSLNQCCAVGRRVQASLGAARAAKAPSRAAAALKKAAAMGKAGTNWMTGIISGAEKFTKAAAKFAAPALKMAQKAGVKMPLDGLLAELDGKKVTLRGLMFQMQDAESKFIPTLLERRTPEADALYKSMSKAISEGRALGQSAINLIDAAIATGSNAQRDMLAGRLAIMVPANFVGKKKIAEDAFNRARIRMEQVNTSRTKSSEQLKSADSLSARNIGRAMAESAGEFGSRAVTGAGWVGEQVEKAGEATKAAVEGYGKYLPYALIIGGVAYIVAISGMLRGRMGHND